MSDVDIIREEAFMLDRDKWIERAVIAEAERDEALRQRDEYEVIAYPSRKGNFRAALAKEDTVE